MKAELKSRGKQSPAQLMDNLKRALARRGIKGK
jgi:hypothetical protein